MLHEFESVAGGKGNYHLRNYEETYRSFDWKEVEAEFSWHQTGKLNAAYEAIDRHAESFRKQSSAVLQGRKPG